MNIQAAINAVDRAIQRNDIDEPQIDRADIEHWFEIGARWMMDYYEQQGTPDEYRVQLPELCHTFNAVLRGEATVTLPL